jgi:type I restriction enzyme S subunit
MAKDDQETLTPRLRLSEFRKERGWNARVLGDVVHFSSGGTPSKDEASYWNGNIPWISASSMYDIRIRDSELKVTPSAIGNGTRLAPKGSILILVRGSMLFTRVPMGIADIDVAFNQDVKALAVSDGINADFLLNQLLALSPRIPVNETGIGAGKIETDTLTKLTVYLPSHGEQQKIADCLSSLDELIAAQGRKVEALKAHKKALMQQLFPREGETLPRLRFPEFRDQSVWEEKKAGSSFGNRIAKGEEGLPIYSVTMHDGMVRRDSFDRNFYDIEIAAGNKKACKNDIAYNMMRMWQGALGVAPEDCLVSPAYIVLSPQQGVVSRFFEYLFKLPASLLLLTSHSRGLTKDRLRLYYDDFARIPLRCPEPAEQQRIADCLSTLGARIAAEANKLAALKTHKQGLMQQLFPSPGGD